MDFLEVFSLSHTITSFHSLHMMYYSSCMYTQNRRFSLFSIIETYILNIFSRVNSLQYQSYRWLFCVNAIFVQYGVEWAGG